MCLAPSQRSIYFFYLFCRAVPGVNIRQYEPYPTESREANIPKSLMQEGLPVSCQFVERNNYSSCILCKLDEDPKMYSIRYGKWPGFLQA